MGIHDRRFRPVFTKVDAHEGRLTFKIDALMEDTGEPRHVRVSMSTAQWEDLQDTMQRAFMDAPPGTVFHVSSVADKGVEPDGDEEVDQT